MLRSRKHDGAHGHAPADTGLMESEHRVVGEQHVKDESGVEEVAVRVLHEQRKARLARVAAVRVGDGAAGR